MVYACFTSIEAQSPEAAINECRRRVRTVLAALGISSQTPVDIKLLSEAHFRKTDWSGWASSGSGGTFPIGHVVEQWDKFFAGWQGFLEAEDELALRIQRALIHLNQAEGAYDAEHKIEECWKVFESIGREGGSAVESWLYRLPRQFVPRTFRRMKQSSREDFVKGRLRTLYAEFRAIRNIRNKAIVQRPIAKPDPVALERWAGIGSKRPMRAASCFGYRPRDISEWRGLRRTRLSN